MSSNYDPNRNPTIVPEKNEPKRRGCPKCGHPDYEGFVAQGAPTFRCMNKECGNVWQGGIIHEQGDPKNTLPATKYKPPLMFDRALVRGGGNNPQYITPDIVEVRTPVDLTPDFRKGQLITDDEEL